MKKTILTGASILAAHPWPLPHSPQSVSDVDQDGNANSATVGQTGSNDSDIDQTGDNLTGHRHAELDRQRCQHHPDQPVQRAEIDQSGTNGIATINPETATARTPNKRNQALVTQAGNSAEAGRDPGRQRSQRR